MYVQRGVSKETLKQAYFDLEKQLQHSPTITEIDEKCLISHSTISKKFGSWEKFVNYVNENGCFDLINNKVDELRKKGLKSFFDIKKSSIYFYNYWYLNCSLIL